MTNHSNRTRTVVYHEVFVPAPANRKDLYDLAYFADQKYKEIHGIEPRHDDSYTVRADEDEIVAVIEETKVQP